MVFKHKAYKIFIGASLFLGLLSRSAMARPEYALRVGNNRCTSCHYSPAGGGPRNLEGKYFGANGKPLTPFSAQGYAGADIKMLYYGPEKHTESRGGMGVIAINLYASLPLTVQEASAAEYRIVAEHNLGGYGGGGPRQLYLRYQSADAPLGTSWRPQHFVLGRLIVPFGLMTDEHRTYVRLQTGTPWNTGFDMGAMISANPYESLHYDLAFLNGQKNNGQAPAADQATLWGSVGNLRWMPQARPFLLGTSASYYEAEIHKDPPVALSAYGVLSFHRLTNNKFPASLLFEYAHADNWNNATLTNQMVTSTTYATALAETSSEGVLAQLNWDYSSAWTYTYKYDRFVPDVQFNSDNYQRHGLGVRHNFLPNGWFMVRFEKAVATATSEKNGSKMGSLDAVFAILSLGI